MPYKDPEKHRATDRAWREAHREDKRAYGRAYSRAYAEAHPEEKRARARAYAKAHPQKRAERQRRRQALKRGATVRSIDLEAIKARDRMRCCICGKKVTDKDFSLDHTVPVSLGGAHSQENLRVAHLYCNIRRGPGRLPVQMVLC